MLYFYRFIITLLALVLLIAILKRNGQDENTVASPAPKTFVSRFGNAVNHKTAKQLAEEANELWEDSNIDRATKKLSKGA